ncbi:ATP phosphoribosyltransferase regulatory subunit [Clostridium sp. DL1XJH146]
MKTLNRYIPEGMRDLLFEECSKKLQIERELRSFYQKNGFSEIISPTIEFYDVFNLGNETIEQQKMYKMFDNQGRILALRADVTTPIARIASTKINKSSYPIKFCYSENVYRINENFHGKNSEITQSGVEIIGAKNIKSDAEIIMTAINALKKIGIKDFKIEIGQANFFKALVEDVNIDEEEIEILRDYIENKNFSAVNDFVDKNIDEKQNEKLKVLKELPKLFGGIEVLDKAKSITKNKKALNALSNIYKVYEVIDEVGLAQYITIDLGLVQHINYYTGIIFKGYADNVGDYILSGGRYDNLLGYFGEELPATGFAINVDNVMLALEDFKPEKLDRVVIFSSLKYNKLVYNAAEKIRDKGYICELSLQDNIDEAYDYCNSNDAYSLISLIDEKKIKVYNFNDKVEEEYILEQYINNL